MDPMFVWFRVGGMVASGAGVAWLGMAGRGTPESFPTEVEFWSLQISTD